MARGLQLLTVALVAFAAGWVAGGRHSQGPVTLAAPQPPEVAAVVGETVETVAEAADPPAPPPSFPFPADLGGRVVAKAVAPSAPPPLPLPGDDLPPTGKGPKPLRASPRVDSELIAKPVYTPPTLRPFAPAAIKPAAPPERVPFDLGARPTDIPSRVVFAEVPPQTARARDVAVPPALPVLGRPLPNRAGLEDPTADVGNAEIVARSVAVALLPAAFLKVVIPDPFEFADQVRPKTPPAAETAPVPVPPMRPR